MFSRLNDVERKLKSLQDRLADPLLPQNPKEFQTVAKEQAALQPIIETYDRYRSIKKQIDENKTLLAQDCDASIREMAKEELPALEAKLEELIQELKVALLPKDPNDEKNIFLEIRAGTGGDEASLFAADLFRMYSRYAETMGWQVELTSSNETGMGGFKEIICQISGEKVYSKLKYESGVHRVQRVPKTEANGRVHTSAVTVAVMPEVEDIEIDIQDKDLRIDVFRSGGHGGQSVNTTDSAVRVTYLPLNMVVICQDGKSQHKNKAQALKVLKARLYDKKMTEQNDSIAKERKEQVGSGDRSEKIRTYNFPQNRVTDHRIGLTLYQLDEALNGKLDSLISPLQAHFQAEALKMA